MKYKEFVKQDKYCNDEEKYGCEKCPTTKENECAFKLRLLCERLIKSTIGSVEWEETAERIKLFGLSNFSMLQLYKGIIEFSK